MTNKVAVKVLVNATFSDEWQGNEDLTTAYQMAIDALLQEKWIPTSKRNPNNAENDWVLAVIREKDTGYQYIPKVGEYRESKDDWYFEELGGWLKDNPDDSWEVVAWMPLPEEYKDE